MCCSLFPSRGVPMTSNCIQPWKETRWESSSEPLIVCVQSIKHFNMLSEPTRLLLGKTGRAREGARGNEDGWCHQPGAPLRPVYAARRIRAPLTTPLLSQILLNSPHIFHHKNVGNASFSSAAARPSTSPRRLPSITVACNQPASRHGDGLIGGADEV